MKWFLFLVVPCVAQEYYRVLAGETDARISEFVSNADIQLPGCYEHVVNKEWMTMKCLRDGKLVIVEIRIVETVRQNRIRRVSSRLII